MSYRDRSSFGKRIEFYVIGQMLREGLDVYIPLVDDRGVDAVVRTENGTYIEIQIKARSKDVKKGDEALFCPIQHEPRKNYRFIFYSEAMKKTWIMSSEEFIDNSCQNKSGKNKGKRSIKFNGNKNGESYPLERFEKYSVTSFESLKNYNSDQCDQMEVSL
jgi:hypothetical protein